jgi:hypothetical protein
MPRLANVEKALKGISGEGFDVPWLLNYLENVAKVEIPSTWRDGKVLERVWKFATLGAKDKDWYQRSGRVAKATSANLGVSTDQMAALASVYSTNATPTNAYNRAVEAVRQYQAKQPIAVKSIGGAAANRKAAAILAGRVKMKGPKHTPFALNQLEEIDPAAFKAMGGIGNEVTIDERLSEIFALPYGMTDRYRPAIEQVIRTMSAARHGGSRPNGMWQPKEFQAAIWIPWKALLNQQRYGNKKPYQTYWATARDAGERAYEKEFGPLPPVGKAGGGVMRGGFPGRDSIPALLTPGELVLNGRQISRITRQLGLPNSGDALYRQATRLATGGVVPPRPRPTMMGGGGSGASAGGNTRGGGGMVVEHLEVNVPPAFNDTEWAIEQGLKKAKFRLMSGW